MATILDQHTFRIVPKAIISGVVGGAGNTITISGSGLKLLTTRHRLLVSLSVDPDITINTTVAGVTGVSEVQEVEVDAAAGTFTLSYNGSLTGALAYNISAADLETALDSVVGVGVVSVTGGPGDVGGNTPYTITFDSSYGNVVTLVSDATLLTGGASTATVTVITPGVDPSPETQTLVIDHVIGGTFTITYDGQTTSALAYNASTAAVQAALIALSNLGPGDVGVSGSPGNYTLSFAASVGNAAQITVDGTNLTVASGITLTAASSELTTNNLTSLVVDLDAYTGEDVTAVSLVLPNVFTETFDVDPDITLAP